MGTISENTISCDSECSACEDINLLPDRADVFIKSHGCVHYNTERGVNYDTPLVLGANKLSNVAGLGQVMNNTLPSLAVHGDIYVSGHIYSGNMVNTNQQHVNAKKDRYIDALEPVVKNGVIQNVTYHHVNPSDNTGVIYVNPINGPIYVILGSQSGDVNFGTNHSITIKDVSLLYNEGSSYNVYVTVPTNTQIFIEHYDSTCRLKVSAGGTYIINSSNGSVTYQYMKTNTGKACWIIKDQFVGNNRVLPGRGLVFNQVQPNDVKKLLNYRA
jgi:hypothetical protein